MELVGKRARIVSDNPCYEKYMDKVLIITHGGVGGRGYDTGLYPQELCCFETEEGSEVPFSLYEYEFELIDYPMWEPASIDDEGVHDLETMEIDEEGNCHCAECCDEEEES